MTLFNSSYFNRPGTVRGSQGETAKVGIFGEQRIGDLSDDVAILFDYGVNTVFDIKSTSTGGGTIQQDSNDLSVAVLRSSTSGSYSIQSRRFLRYSPGHAAIGGFTFAGQPNPPDNIYFCLKRNGVEKHRTEINGSDLEHIDWTQLNVFEFSFGYYGIAPIMFQVLKPKTNVFIPVHIHRRHGEEDHTHMGSPRLPIRMEVNSNGWIRVGAFDNDDGFYLEFHYSPGNVIAKTASWQAGSMSARRSTSARPFHYTNKYTGIGTDLRNLVTFRSKTTFNGRTNKIRSLLQLFTWLPYAANDLVEIFLIKDATPSAAFVFTDLSPGNSVLEYASRVAGGINDVTLTGGATGIADAQYPQTGQGSQPSSYSRGQVPAEALGLLLEPADGTYSIAARVASGTASIFVSVNWEEDF